MGSANCHKSGDFCCSDGITFERLSNNIFGILNLDLKIIFIRKIIGYFDNNLNITR